MAVAAPSEQQVPVRLRSGQALDFADPFASSGSASLGMTEFVVDDGVVVGDRAGVDHNVGWEQSWDG